MNKPVTLVANDTDGIDLMTERSAGERVLILTGSRRRSVQFWLDIVAAGQKALIDMAYSPDPSLAPAGTIIERAAKAEAAIADPVEPCLLLEAGGRDNYHWVHIPVGYLYCIGNPRTDWCFETEI